MTTRLRRPFGMAIVPVAGRPLGIRRGTHGTTTTRGTGILGTGTIPGTIQVGMVGGIPLGTTLVGTPPGAMVTTAIMATMVAAGIVDAPMAPVDAHGAGRVCRTIRLSLVAPVPAVRTTWAAIVAALILTVPSRHVPTARPAATWAVRAPAAGRVAVRRVAARSVAEVTAVAARQAEVVPWVADTRMAEDDKNLNLNIMI